MFSILPTPRKTQSHHYTPHFSSPLSSSTGTSPLSPRDVNLPSLTPIFNHDKIMSSPTPAGASKQIATTPANEKFMTPPSSRKESAFSKRTTKPNPLLQGKADRSEGRETRRKLFLKKVREGAEEKRWRDRGGDDEIMRMLWVAEERRWEERRRREVSGMGEDDEAEELSLDEVMADEVAMQEEQELEALFLGMNQEEHGINVQQDTMVAQQGINPSPWAFSNQQSPTPQDQPPTPSNTMYGSDDEEYDHIFMDVIQEEKRMSSQQQQQGHVNGDQDMMDIS